MSCATLIGLSQKNLIVLRGQITGKSAADVIVRMNTVSVPTIYIYISSPGGSVMDGLTIVDQIEVMKHRGTEVHCIADVALSMAFVIFQSCPTRHVTTASILMQHQMSLTVQGNLRNIETYMDFIRRTSLVTDTRQAERMGLDLNTFRLKVVSDWWLQGADIVVQGGADHLTLVYCESELTRRNVVDKINTEFYSVNITYSGCPIARSPLKVSQLPLVNSFSAEVTQVLDDNIPARFLAKAMGCNT